MYISEAFNLLNSSCGGIDLICSLLYHAKITCSLLQPAFTRVRYQLQMEYLVLKIYFNCSVRKRRVRIAN